MRPVWSSPYGSRGETPAVYALLAAFGIAFLVDFYTHDSLSLILSWPASVAWLGSLHLWQPLTFPLVHGSSFFYLVTDALVLFFFGSSLERSWGAGRFLFFFFASGIVAGLAAMAMSPFTGGGLFMGMVGSLLATVVAFASLNPYATVILFIFPLQARWLAALSIAYELFARSGFYGGPVASLVAVALTTLFAWAFATHRLSLSALRRGSGPSLKERIDRWQQRRRMRQWQRKVSRIDKPDDLFKK